MDRETALATWYYRRQARITLAAQRAAAREWKQLTGRDLTGAWMSGTGQRMVALVTGGQLASATGAGEYVSRSMTVQGAPGGPPELTVNAAAFAGLAADGRPLESLLYEPVIHTKQAIGEGLELDEALGRGLADLLRIVGTEVPDAGRQATGAGIAADKRCRGYVRVLNPPSCARCVVLAGKEYGWNAGFQRHPHCDCVHQPMASYRRGNPSMDPAEYFRSLDRAEQNRAFGAAGARAIRDGADINQVVNARRGVSTVGSWVRDGVTHRGRIADSSRIGGRPRLTTTTEGMTKRGLARRRLREVEAAGRAPAGARLTPEAIYELASDRDDAIRLLYRYGYLY
jgi:hypothetical protein